MMRRWRWGALLGAAFIFLNFAPAQAALKLCNQTSYVLYAAAGWHTGSDNLTQGWARVTPGDCRNVLPARLTAASYFLYARSSQAHTGTARSWGGTVSLCVKDTDFSFTTPAKSRSCTTDDAFSVPFAPLNTHGLVSWTTTLTETPSLPTPDSARQAGIKRLLGDLGYKFSDDKTRDAALGKFRTRMKIAPNASPQDLFDALETEAMKSSSPAGYSICNDTANVVWAALAFTPNKDTASAGWWKISPGGCAHPLTQVLNLQKVYVHAEGHGKSALVSGSKKFCITNVTFQAVGTEPCKKRGLTEAGFAATNTKGLTGYTAHIGEDGLEPSFQTGTPK